jgi:hypothetical protein
MAADLDRDTELACLQAALDAKALECEKLWLHRLIDQKILADTQTALAQLQARDAAWSEMAEQMMQHFDELTDANRALRETSVPDLPPEKRRHATPPPSARELAEKAAMEARRNLIGTWLGHKMKSQSK